VTAVNAEGESLPSTEVSAVSYKPRKIPDSGQVTSFTGAAGEDNDYTINPPSYTDNSNGTIADNVTGLMWQKCSSGQTNDATCSGTATTKTWADAVTYCDTLSVVDQFGSAVTGWRMPTVRELQSVADYSKTIPSIDATPFPATVPTWYWSSTPYAGDTSNAWGVDFRFGESFRTNKTYDLYVRCVRGEESVQSFTDNGDDTVTDNVTGLTWQRCGIGHNNDPTCTAIGPGVFQYENFWDTGINLCEGLSLGGQTDWRMPNVKELLSLVDYSKYNPSIDTAYFPGSMSKEYWSSTTHEYNSNYAWEVNFQSGDVTLLHEKATKYPSVRCVRGNP